MKVKKEIDKKFEINAESFFKLYAEQDEGTLLFLDMRSHKLSFYKSYQADGVFITDEIILESDDGIDYFDAHIREKMNVYRVNDNHISFGKVA